MDNSKYISLSGQISLMKNMDAVANNVANANTDGYKKDGVIFDSYMHDGNHFPNDVRIDNNSEVGHIRLTHSPLDLAIATKNCYFAVDTEHGLRYTRNGHFTLDVNGFLVNTQGQNVLSEDNSPILLGNAKGAIFKKSGDIIDGKGNDVGKIGIFYLRNPNDIQKIGGNLIATAQDIEVAEDVRLVQGALESSNVNSVEEMTKMMEITREVNFNTQFVNNVHELQMDTLKILSEK